MGNETQMSQVIEKSETGSTSDDAKKLAADGAPHLTVVWAHKQTAGRGRHDRKWISPDGNVYWSIVLRPSDNWPTFSDIVYVNALAVHKTISDVIGSSKGLELKWPNDVLLNGKKIAGSLLEGSGHWSSGRPQWIVIGTGINVVSHPDPSDMRYPPTSLFQEGFKSVTREALISKLRVNLEALINVWISNSFERIRALYVPLAHNLHREIRVGLSPDKSTYRDGIYRGIDERGQLLLEKADGTVDELNSAEVILKK